MIGQRKTLWGDKWILAGDFNDIISNKEKWGGSTRSDRTFKDFKEFISDNELIDLGFDGHPWTWSNNWENGGEIRQRLDRALCNKGWNQLFDSAKCSHVETVGSDHSMLLLDTCPQQSRRKKNRFSFDKRWLQSEDIHQVIRGAWNQDCEGSRMFKITRKITQCRIALLKWNNTFQSNAKKKIMQMKKQLQRTRESFEKDNQGRMKELKHQLKTAYQEEELFLSQKARCNWLSEGDKNSKFFHAIVKGRRKKNTIQKIQRDNGTWTENDQEMGEEIAQYYDHLFTSSAEECLDEILEGMPHRITRSMNDKLTRDVDEKEVKQALFSMNPNKAPGSDGMSPLFFQKFWYIIKSDIIAAVKNFFHSGFMLKSFNHTVISLIPEVNNPTSLKNYRPISLCKVVYKIIAKILANRLKTVLELCISKNQAAFVPGRQILDNVIISHEYLHFLKNKRQWKEGFLAMKLDMSKAYDRVEWNFLEEVMKRLGFCEKWIRWILSCISSVTYSFNVNGEHRGYVIPQRGIRQGDPLSPYLFLLCSEGFSNMLRCAERDKRITGVKISRQGPVVTHLFFADDSLLFCRADPKEAEELMPILRKYGKGSGQEINLEKSSVFFSKNVTEDKQRQICKWFDKLQVVTQGKYLGLPMVITRSKQQIFSFIKERLEKKMKNWKNKLLSSAGKDVLIKAVSMALPTYSMSCFKLPIRLCKELASIMSNF